MSADALTIETFAEYGIGMVFLLVRLYARLYVGGIRGLRLDDAFAVSGMIFWSMLTAIIYLLGVYGNNIGLNEQTAMLVPDSKIPHMILGSKLAFMNWIWYICYIWCLKGVLLCLYWKLTYVNVPPISDLYNCTLREPLYVVIAVFNVLQVTLRGPIPRTEELHPNTMTYRSDACIILIPIPILAKLQIPLQRKIILVVMFSSGIFIMISTILRAYYSLSSITNLGTALGWADRECFVAAIVVSLPGIKPLFRNTRWLGSSHRKNSKNPYYHSDGYNATGSKTGKTKTFVSSRSRKSGGFELDDVLNTNKGSRVSDAGSEEYILEGNQQVPAGAGKQDPMAIRVTTEYTLEHEQGRSGQMRS
ncbi:hypothetical protein N7489_007824 [Penicillium chrysogenum]|uniref:uncharacterized protein n=1 Tax=Penicillium chrysogenum TaxID=5076 RepID=UPI0024DF2DEB|nr:uncharacterized protein N7489_007824 [Penicillium chrysogenum]KAJ5237733.1 hypothetical protein N7489_007824 [Penicillium chrysogenum]